MTVLWTDATAGQCVTEIGAIETVGVRPGLQREATKKQMAAHQVIRRELIPLFFLG